MILIEPDELAAVRLACRHCENCDVLSIVATDIYKGAETAMRSRGLDRDRHDYVTLGIVDPAVAESRPAGTAEATWLEDHLLRWRDEISSEIAGLALTRLLDAPIAERRPRRLVQRAWEIADELGWAKLYDAHYLALASMLDMPLLTLDGRLRRGAARSVTTLGPMEL